MKLNRILCKLGIHKYTWTPETRDWFFTGIKEGHIGGECVRCGKLSDRL